MRLDKFLAESGLGTRSEVKRIIASGRVAVNGTIEKNPAEKIAEEEDTVTADNVPVRYAAFEYYMLNKPKGVISATRDTQNPEAVCVIDLISNKVRKDLFPVGRLDKDTEGLLLITNDGALSHRLLSPAHHVDKTYEVELDGELSNEAARRLMNGVGIGDEKPTFPCKITITGSRSCLITIKEGRYHQIKRMFQTEGLTVTELKRLSMGPLTLDPALAPGEYRKLSGKELKLLTGC